MASITTHHSRPVAGLHLIQLLQMRPRPHQTTACLELAIRKGGCGSNVRKEVAFGPNNAMNRL